MAKKLLQKAEVAEIRDETDRVRAIRIMHSKKTSLQPFEAGAHVTIAFPGGMRRQYSLCGDPADTSCYWLGVLKEEESRGGSRAMHDLRPGQTLFVSYPANSFPLLAEPARIVLLAGGIGITPILSMVHQLRREKRPFELHYCGRRLEDMAFRRELDALVPAGDLHLHVSRGDSGADRLDVAGLLKDLPRDAALLACGPDRLLAQLGDFSERDADLSGRIHVEQFSAVPPGEQQGDPFEIEVLETGDVIHVGARETALQGLREHGYVIPSSCEGGICGECRVELVAGEPLHRDRVLNPDEREAAFMTCISRANGRVRLSLPAQPRTMPRRESG